MADGICPHGVSMLPSKYSTTDDTPGVAAIGKAGYWKENITVQGSSTGIALLTSAPAGPLTTSCCPRYDLSLLGVADWSLVFIRNVYVALWSDADQR